jgi:hypothetical protein
MMTIDDARALKGYAQQVKLPVPTPKSLLKALATVLIGIPWLFGAIVGKTFLGGVWVVRQVLWVVAWVWLAFRKGFWDGVKAVPKKALPEEPHEPAWMTQDWGNGSPDDEDFSVS